MYAVLQKVVFRIIQSDVLERMVLLTRYLVLGDDRLYYCCRGEL